MPSISGHLTIAKFVSDKLQIVDSDFIKGNLIPDLEKEKIKSHYKIQGTKYLIPDIEYVKNNLDLKDKTNLGILTHLLLDLHFLEDYVTPKYPDLDVFDDGRIYHDYDILNKDIVSHFNLDVDKLEKDLREIKEERYQEKLEQNIRCLHLKEEGKTEILKKEEFIEFLEKVSPIIVEEIKNIL